MVKIFRGSDSRLYYKKAVLRGLKNFTEKNLCMSLFLNKVAGLHPEFFSKKNASVHVFSCKLCQRTFLAKHVRVTASAKYAFAFHVNLSHKMLPLILFFPFYFKYFPSKYFSFLKVLNN